MPTCRITGCGHGRRGTDLLCKRCWNNVPRNIRDAVLGYHLRGPRRSPEYFDAVNAAIRAAKAALAAGRTAPTTTSNGD